MRRGDLIAGRYELVERLGRGGMGEVWAGRDRMLHRDVAVKMLVLDEATPADLPRWFEREAVAAAQITHPNVAALHDRGVQEDLWFLVMERADGASLAEHMRHESPMDVGRALRIAEEICAALVAAHRAQVIHYDIKPHNVILTSDDRVKVIDFGIAGFTQHAFPLAHSSQLAPVGTPEYGAPEQFFSERGDARSDLYALGSVLFALLTGRPPFTGQNGLVLMRHKLAEEAPSLGTLRPGVPPAVIQLVAELLERDPDRRPQAAETVHGCLVRLRTEVTERVGDGALSVLSPTRRETMALDPGLSSIGAARNADGRLEVFVTGTDHALWHRWQLGPNGAWSEWASRDGVITTAPTVFRNPDGRLEVFAGGADGRVWHIWQTSPNGAWMPDWSPLGNQQVLGPRIAVFQNQDGRLEVFVRGTDHALWHTWQTAPNGGWSEWASRGGVLRSCPAVFQNEDGRLEVFVRGTDHALWHTWQTVPNGGWSQWASRGGELNADPAVFQNQDGRLEVFAIAPDLTLRHLWQRAPNGNWTENWAPRGGCCLGVPAVFQEADGRLRVMVRGTDLALWSIGQRSPNGVWGTWTSLGGSLVGDPRLGRNADGRLDVFATGTDHALWHKWQTAPNNGWTPAWTSRGGSVEFF
ncbi:hypothetical protein GCM10009801_63440 [Streptomyces albiaxialis]|uniref:non-specific serine/threonine protein kinase n=1 Tax=Streptomyces albiaxialis TaxID=329523 RepID=A0ABN2WNY3_9ACTN